MTARDLFSSCVMVVLKKFRFHENSVFKKYHSRERFRKLAFLVTVEKVVIKFKMFTDGTLEAYTKSASAENNIHFLFMFTEVVNRIFFGVSALGSLKTKNRV